MNATGRLPSRHQTVDEAFCPPENFLEVDVVNPETHGIGAKRYTDYEVKVRVSALFLVSNFCRTKRLNEDIFYRPACQFSN